MGNTSLSPDGQRSSRTNRAIVDETPDEVLLNMVKGDRCKNRFRGSAAAKSDPVDEPEEEEAASPDKKPTRKKVGIKQKTQYELAFIKRKALRDKGMWKAQVPPYTPGEAQDEPVVKVPENQEEDRNDR